MGLKEEIALTHEEINRIHTEAIAPVGTLAHKWRKLYLLNRQRHRL